MKRLADLTVEDLTSAPVWRYEGGDGVDAVVVEQPRGGLSQMDDEIFLAATDFVLPDASRHLGFCFPVDDAGLDYLQPAIVTPRGHVQFWFDGAATAEVLSAQWAALGKRAEEVFPVRFRCRVPVDGREVTGVIPGIETSADILPARPAGSLAQPLPESDEVPYRSGRPDGSVLSARPSRVRRRFANRDGVFVTRTAPRRRVEMVVEFDQGESRGTGITGDVSRSGMFVRSARTPNGGPVVSLTVHLPGGREILLMGKVVRSAAASDVSQAPGFALALTDKPAEYDEFFSRLLDFPE
jgi:hypothetical protein